MKSSLLIAAFLAFALVGCKTTQTAGTSGPASPSVAPLSVEFTWAGTGSCFDPGSPAFTIGAAPAGTKALHFKMVDLDAPGYAHGGGKVAYSGQPDVPKGAFRYKGPCPPQGERHRYQWTVEAIGADGKVVARGRAMRMFPAS